MNQPNINKEKTPRPENPSSKMPLQDEPVLAAIDLAKWTDDEIATVMVSKTSLKSSIYGANVQIEAIRTAYLASKQQSSVKESLTVQPSDGGAFERVLDEVYDLYPTHMKDIRSKEIVSRLVSAYYHDRNADRAADKQRIAELEADKAQLVDAAKAKDDMLVCYRIGKQPSEKLFARLEKANLTIAKHGGEA